MHEFIFMFTCIVTILAFYAIGFVHGMAAVEKRFKQAVGEILRLASRFAKGGKHDTTV